MINNIQYTTFKLKVEVHKLFSFHIFYRREKEYPTEFINQCINILNSLPEVELICNELKKVFETVGVPFPVFVLRNSFMLLENKDEATLKKLKGATLTRPSRF